MDHMQRQQQLRSSNFTTDLATILRTRRTELELASITADQYKLTKKLVGRDKVVVVIRAESAILVKIKEELAKSHQPFSSIS